MISPSERGFMNNFYRLVSMPPLSTEEEKRAFVQSCDKDFEARLASLAERIASGNELQFIGLTGPTCSGKTTAAHKLTEALKEHGHRVHVVSIDDFYYDKSYLTARAEKDESIEIDYDSEETIDISLLEEKTKALLLGKETEMPRFDFQTGLRCKGKIITPRKGDVFLFEGIQILYPRVHRILGQGAYQSVYIAPMSAIEAGGKQFSPNRIRLMRRLVRDSIYRSSDASFTLYLWQSVRENEEKSIFPNAHLCNSFLDSTCAYELGMLKPYLERLLKDSLKKDGRELDAAQTILLELADIEPISSDYITPNSLYKEFI